MKLTSVEQQFLGKAKCIGGVFLLAPPDALEFIEANRKVGVPISGIEGFFIHDEDRIQPSQDHTVDFSIDIENSHDLASQFIDERRQLENPLGKELYFEVMTS